jgi:exopolyphosphatase / guanosine-5'-triphosphate,3'-diphosphate pyrophosphatase
MAQRVAVADLGTNTFNLLIAEVTGGTPKKIFSEEIPVKLGEGGINSGIITSEAWVRGLNAIDYIHGKTTEYNCGQVETVATSAIRNASNGAEFTQAIQSRTGIEVKIIDGEEEAELIYLGVRSTASLDTVSLIMDIGGGSIEFILCDQKQIFWKKSYPIGAARIKEKFCHSDPINAENIRAIEQHLDNVLDELYLQCQSLHPQCLIGSAGAFETFAELTFRKYNVTYNLENGYTFSMGQFFEISDNLLQSDLAARQNMPGLVAFRTDMIVPATIITNHILQKTGINSLKLSCSSLKEGVLAKLISS